MSADEQRPPNQMIRNSLWVFRGIYCFVDEMSSSRRYFGSKASSSSPDRLICRVCTTFSFFIPRS